MTDIWDIIKWSGYFGVWPIYAQFSGQKSMQSMWLLRKLSICWYILMYVNSLSPIKEFQENYYRMIYNWYLQNIKNTVILLGARICVFWKEIVKASSGSLYSWYDRTYIYAQKWFLWQLFRRGSREIYTFSFV